MGEEKLKAEELEEEREQEPQPLREEDLEPVSGGTEQAIKHNIG
jgi:hypothetical protein